MNIHSPNGDNVDLTLSLDKIKVGGHISPYYELAKVINH